MQMKSLHGVFTALITPFKEDFSIDFDGLANFIEWQINSGIHGLVPCGTTGEYSTLSFEEYCQVIEKCINVTKNRVPVIAGRGSNCTNDAIRKTKFAESAGADAALIAAPYYNKPTQQGLYYHFKNIHDETNIPIVIYNVPGRCSVDIFDVTIAKIMELPRVVGLKDATGDLNRPLNLKSMAPKKEIFLLSGEDSTALAFNIHGGVGCISVTSNVAPEMCANMQNLFFSNKFEDAIKINGKLFKLNQILFCESNPIPVKHAVSLVHKNLSSQLRLPLTQLSPENQIKVNEIIKSLKII